MLTRYCKACGREIKVSLPYDPTAYVYYQKKWYCTDCFTAMTTPRILKNNWFEKTKEFVLQEVSKDNLCQYFMKHYEISKIPNKIFIRLDAIYKGTDKGLAQPIPPHELLDIVERKENYIDSCLRKKGVTGVPMINYALTVACGSYKSYKEWQASVKAKQEQAKQEAEERQGYHYKLRGYVPSDESDCENMIIALDNYKPL